MLFFKPKAKPAPAAKLPTNGTGKPGSPGGAKTSEPPVFFTWDEAAHGLDIPGMDEDHEKVVGLINLVHTALIHDRDRAYANQVMEDVINEMRSHFFREEELMEQVGYPDRDAHTGEHFNLLKEARELARQLHAGTLSALVFPTFLKNWFMGHTKGSDRKFGEWLKANGQL